MKLTTVVCTSLLPLWLGGCILANAQTETDFPIIEPQSVEVEEFNSKMVAQLYNSCDGPDYKKLDQIDAVMKSIYHIGFDHNKHKRLRNNHPIYNLGNQLYDITKKIYAKSLSVEQCQKDIQDFNHQLLEAGVNLK